MRATDIKRRYSELWAVLEGAVLNDCLEAGVTDKQAQTIAHNAAFVACAEIHDRIKFLSNAVVNIGKP
jgi:hypothetical protein